MAKSTKLTQEEIEKQLLQDLFITGNSFYQTDPDGVKHRVDPQDMLGIPSATLTAMQAVMAQQQSRLLQQQATVQRNAMAQYSRAEALMSAARTGLIASSDLWRLLGQIDDPSTTGEIQAVHDAEKKAEAQALELRQMAEEDLRRLIRSSARVPDKLMHQSGRPLRWKKILNRFRYVQDVTCLEWFRKVVPKPNKAGMTTADVEMLLDLWER